MKKTELIFLPAPANAHLVSTIEFGKRLLDQDDRLSITILIMKLPFSSHTDAYTKSLTASHPQIHLLDLPQVEPPPLDLLTKSSEAFFYELIESHEPHVKNAIREIMSSGSTRVAGLVIDIYCVSMIDAADALCIPSYIFIVSNAGFLSLMMHLPDRHDRISSDEFKISDPESQIPGISIAVPARVLPSALCNKYGYEFYVKVAKKFRDVKGIIVNTFSELESCALNSFLDDPKTPPVYPVGPVLNLYGQRNQELDDDQREKILKWLDERPQSSVLYLCFGTWGAFHAPQVKDIALALEQSEYSFLWAMRVPASSDFKNPEEMLPEGFLERIGERGMVCGWAPQVEVLAHKAIGGFVNHCGWNSFLESLWYGVPIVTWPRYAENQLNALRLVKELGLAVELKLDSHKDNELELVPAEEIARAVRYVMEMGDSGVRKKVEEASEMSRKALMEGGSSIKSMEKLIKDIME